jgi:Lon protease-like protein
MPLQLHIFEERYKIMMNECIDTQSPFGVVLIESGQEALGPVATPHMVGTTAYIKQVKKLPMGRMNIVALGQERFQIQDIHKDRPYLSADVELLPLRAETTLDRGSNDSKLRSLVRQYLDTLEDAGKLETVERAIPDDPTALAYLAAVLLQTDNSDKQELLETSDTGVLLDRLTGMYRREVVLLDAMLNPPLEEKLNRTPFSLN